MADQIEQILSEIITQAPELKGREESLHKAISELVSMRPQAVMDPVFRTDLKRRLLNHRARPVFAWRPLLYPLAGAALVILLFVAVRDRQPTAMPSGNDVAFAPESVPAVSESINQAPPQLMMAAKQAQTMKLTSPAFEDGGAIPPEYTCDGNGISPPLYISGIPAGTQRFVLIMEDPDAPNKTFLHWIAWNIPGLTTEIGEGQMPKGAVQGLNGAGKPGYIGPCPPSGEHHYLFSIYAIDMTLDLPEETAPAELRKIIEGHILEETSLTGLYQKK